jgi:hypothetical protein
MSDPKFESEIHKIMHTIPETSKMMITFIVLHRKCTVIWFYLLMQCGSEEGINVEKFKLRVQGWSVVNVLTLTSFPTPSVEWAKWRCDSDNLLFDHVQQCNAYGKLVIPRAFGSKSVRSGAQGFHSKTCKICLGISKLGE